MIRENKYVIVLYLPTFYFSVINSIVNFFEKHEILKQTFMLIEKRLNTITTLYILIYIHNIDKQR